MGILNKINNLIDNIDNIEKSEIKEKLIEIEKNLKELGFSEPFTKKYIIKLYSDNIPGYPAEFVEEELEELKYSNVLEKAIKEFATKNKIYLDILNKKIDYWNVEYVSIIIEVEYQSKKTLDTVKEELEKFLENEIKENCLLSFMEIFDCQLIGEKKVKIDKI